jgi:hypothetical protein
MMSGRHENPFSGARALPSKSSREALPAQPLQIDIVRERRESARWDINTSMKRTRAILAAVAALCGSALAQGPRLWVLRAPGEMVEYDPATFAAKQTVKVPAEALQSPQSIQVNRMGQILFAPVLSLPLADSDLKAPNKVWLWDGHEATTFDLGVKHEVGKTGSNQLISESAPVVFLSSDGAHLYWFANDERRLQREDVDLSVTTTWQAWRTDLRGGGRESIAEVKFPECSCPTGACEESCPVGVAWAPANGIGDFFLVTQFVAAKDQPTYKTTTEYRQQGGKWQATALNEPLRRVLDADSNGDAIIEAIPDTGCCGWANQSDDQTFVLTIANKLKVFDELATYKNPDYDVSFYTSTAQLSPDAKAVAMTIVATAQVNQPIQLADQGQANPEESKQIRRALAELPAVEVKSVEVENPEARSVEAKRPEGASPVVKNAAVKKTEDAPRGLAFAPHATLVGWINDKELLLVEDHLLVLYNVATGARRKSNIRVEGADNVLLR